MTARWINPYIEKLDQFPGRLFAFDDFDAAAAALHARLAGYERWICEVGSGSGGHLIDWAERQPKTACIGFELRFKRSVRTMEKAQARRVENVFLCRTRGEDISKIFSPETLSGVFVNFPDPWRKKRWKKHQILNQKFLKQVYRLLQAQGFLSVKTDSSDYFEQFCSIVQSDSCWAVERISRDLHRSEYAAENIETEFERLFRSQGLPIHYLYLRKKEIR